MTLTSFAATLPGRLLFVANADIWLHEHGQLRAITADRISRQPAWSRDGQRIAFIKLWTSGSDLWVADAQGANAQELTDFTYHEDRQQLFARQPIWSDDASRLLFLSQEGSRDMQLWQLSLADRRRQRLLMHGERSGGLDHPRLSPDGRVLAVTSFQPGRGPAGRPQVWTYQLPNGPWRQLTDAPGGAYDPAWSPDGRLAYVVRSPDPSHASGRHDIWLMRADGSAAQPATTTGLNRAPAWSPDGAWLAFLSARGGAFDIWALPAASADGAASSGAAAGLPVARQVTQNGTLEATSGLAWAP
jgi:TolB protein